MAEFGIATGALQVAQAGLSLSKTLYEYLDAVRNADKHVKAIALEVRVTSSTLENLASLLRDHNAEKLCSVTVVSDAQAAFEGCREAFAEVDETFKPLVKVNSDGKSSVSSTGRWTLPFKKGKVETLQANLERLKTTLLLMLSVLSFAREQARNVAENQSKIIAEKLRIELLIKGRTSAQKDANNRYAQLIRESVASKTARATFDSEDSLATKVLPNASDTQKSIQQTDGGDTEAGGPSQETEKPVSTHSPVQTLIAGGNSISPSEDQLLSQLTKCASAVSQLADTVDFATHSWKRYQTFEHSPLEKCLKQVRDAMKVLAEHNPQHRRFVQHSSHVSVSPLPPLPPPPPPARGQTAYDPIAYSEYMPLSADTQPLTSATYIPSAESFGPGVGVPPLLITPEENSSQHGSDASGHVVRAQPARARADAEQRLVRKARNTEEYAGSQRDGGHSASAGGSSQHPPTAAAQLLQSSPAAPFIDLPPTEPHSAPTSPFAETCTSFSMGAQSPSASLASSSDQEWPLRRVQSWLIAHGFSREWQAAFEHLDVHDESFLAIGRSDSQRNIGFMPQTVLPQLLRECVANGVQWDTSKAREEARRMRRLVRDQLKVGGAAVSRSATTNFAHSRRESSQVIGGSALNAESDEEAKQVPGDVEGPSESSTNKAGEAVGVGGEMEAATREAEKIQKPAEEVGGSIEKAGDALIESNLQARPIPGKLFEEEERRKERLRERMARLAGCAGGAMFGAPSTPVPMNAVRRESSSRGGNLPTKVYASQDPPDAVDELLQRWTNIRV